MNKYDFITFCPKCHEESLEVKVTDSGEGFTGEYTIHWFNGECFCQACGHEGEYSDSN